MEETVTNERPSFVSPKKILEEISLTEGNIVVDYGASCGHWAIPAAIVVGTKGKVHAIDNNIEILNLLKSKAQLRNIQNIDIEELNFEKEDTTFKDHADLVIVANILHLISNKEKFVKRAEAILKDDGKILLIDWLTGQSLFGPPERYRLNEEQIISLFETVGMRLLCTVDAGQHHFGLVFDKGRKYAKRKEKSE
jgi:ubiquinone/menaquinone biosynthesis C-methylase UbiE